MIFDNIKNIDTYKGLGKNFEKAIEFIKTLSKDSELGKLEIDGREVHSNIMVIETKSFEDGKMEAHKNYADIQYILDGCEYAEIGDVANMSEKTEYNAEKDVQFYDGDGNVLRVEAGDFYIVFPHDAHRPGCFVDESSTVKKAVIKVRV